jgi:hypothetical protein
MLVVKNRISERAAGGSFMKKAIVILALMIVAGAFNAPAITRNSLEGKVVHVSGAESGMGVVVEYEVDNYIVLEGIDGSGQQTFNLKNRDYRLDILAESREAYLKLQREGVVPEGIPVIIQSRPAVSAFPYLSDLASRSKKMRFSSGIQGLVVGIVFSGLGAVFMASSDDPDVTDAGKYMLAGGVVVSGLGALDLAFKSGLERKYDHAQTLTSAEREAYCAEALASESSKAMIGRFVNAGLSLGLATFCLVADPLPVTDEFIYQDFDWNIYGAIAFGISGVASLIIPSYEETTYHRYLDEKEGMDRNGRLTWNIGVIPRGFALALQYNF